MSLLHDPITRRRALERLSLVVGGALAAPLASGLLAGCRAPAPGEAYAYRLLDPDQQRLLAALVDQILPATDTPGASDAGVPQFIDTMLADWYSPAERDEFLAGLMDFDARAQEETGNAFVDLDASEQMARVAALDAAAFTPHDAPEPLDDDVAEAAQEGTFAAQQQAQDEVAGTQGELGEAMRDDAPADVGTGEAGGDPNARAPAERSRAAADAPRIYTQLKQLTLAGYYTSEAGATQELQYNAVMGRYDADVPLSEIGRAWA